MRPTLVVLDIMMPNVSGVEMVSAMRAHASLATTPVILLSAKADEDLLVRLLDESARDYVVKPFSEKELRVRMRNAIIAEQNLVVANSGTGIAAEMLPRIFELFVQDQHAMGRSEGGLGIGLTIVRGLVELHGGTVSAYSDGLGTGSQFLIRLPAVSRRLVGAAGDPQ